MMANYCYTTNVKTPILTLYVVYITPSEEP